MAGVGIWDQGHCPKDWLNHGISKALWSDNKNVYWKLEDKEISQPEKDLV